jgi:hypothetical protein
MLFTELLTKHGIEEDKLSAGLKVKIKRYRGLQKAVDDAKAKLPNIKVPKTLVDTQTEIKTGEEKLGQWNEEICTAIETWKVNEDSGLNAKKKANVEKARTNKAGGAAAGASATPKAEKGAGAAAATTTTTTVAKKDDVTEVEVVEETEEEKEKKKKKNKTIFGVLAGLAVTALLGWAGYEYMKKD